MEKIFFKRVKFGLALAAMVALFSPGLSPAQKKPDMSVARLRCEYLENPLGIDVKSPRLSWIVKSERRGQHQTAYRVLAASSREKLDREEGDLWDSGKVTSDETIQITYRGKTLGSRAHCFWKVMVWDSEGRASAWSDPAMWSMGLLDKSDWKAKWIGYDTAWNLIARKIYLPLSLLRKVYLPCPYLRKSFSVDKSVKRAEVHVSALGLFELYLNGRRVGNDYFTPGWTDYNKRVYYLTYDVTDLVRPSGENVVAAILSDGWYAGNVGGRGQRIYGSRLRLLAQLHIEYADGTEKIIASDDSWRASQGPIREADIQAGESFDARKEMPGWSAPGFDDRAWKKVDVTESISALVQAYPGIPVRKTGEIKPVKITEPKPGVYVFNLGQNFAGWARLRVKGQAGDRVVLRFAEMLNPDGSIYTKNLRTARATDTYVLGGKGEEVWEPRFTYHGFQYVELTGYPGKPTIEDITGVALNSGLTMTGSFESSDPLINKLYSNIVWGQRSNYFEAPTDCPQRDERLGWTGDTQVFIRTAAYNMDVAPFFTKWLKDLEDGQYSDGRFPDVAPKVVAYGSGAAGWGDAGIICPWNIYRVYGDRRIIEDHYEAMSKYMRFLKERSPGFISPALGTYGDWLNVKAPTPRDYIATAYFGYDAELMAKMARAAGREKDAAEYETLFANIRDAFTKQYLGKDGMIKGNTQTAYLMALRFGLVPDDQRGLVAGQLVKRIEERDWRLSTGFLGVNLLLPTLTDIGRTDVAYRLIQNRRYPSWGYSIDQGATTTWERWNSYTKEQGFGDPGMNSFNHYAYGSAGEWMFSTLAGIDAESPGFKKIKIRPQPGGGVSWARASYDSVRGMIKTFWRVEGDGFKLEVTIPANTTALVYIPARSPSEVLESGLSAAQAPGVRFVSLENGDAIFEVGSGNYSFSSRTALKPVELK